MTLDKLLKLSPDQWDTLSDSDLYKVLEPYFKVTRPEQADLFATVASSTKPKSNSHKQDSKFRTQTTLSEIAALMAKAGLNKTTI